MNVAVDCCAVTVLMPVLNPHPVFFRAAVASVLAQSFADFELLIVEDPSPRQAREFLADFRDPRIHHLENAERTSLVDQLNQGLGEARGELVARFDADDICFPDRLEKQFAYLERHPDIAVVGGQLAVIDEEGRDKGFRVYPRDHDDIVRVLRRYNALAHPTVMFRKAIVLGAGGYRYRAALVEDYELWSRLAQQGVRFANLPEAVIRYRIHPSAAKSAMVRRNLRGTLEVKNMHWRRHMNFGDRLRMWGEKLLLWLPPSWVVRLFMRTQLQSRLPTA